MELIVDGLRHNRPFDIDGGGHIVRTYATDRLSGH